MLKASNPIPILASGWQELESKGTTYQLSIRVPDGDGPFPVMICLHDHGGSAWTDCQAPPSHIRVGPSGPTHTWNVVKEESKADDCGFVGSTMNTRCHRDER